MSNGTKLTPFIIVMITGDEKWIVDEFLCEKCLALSSVRRFKGGQNEITPRKVLYKTLLYAQILNSDFCCDNELPELANGTGLLLHHDSARPRKPMLVRWGEKF